jgi:hypothetical protein
MVADWCKNSQRVFLALSGVREHRLKKICKTSNKNQAISKNFEKQAINKNKKTK